MLEELINRGSDKQIQEFREHQLESLRIVSVVVRVYQPYKVIYANEETRLL